MTAEHASEQLADLIERDGEAFYLGETQYRGVFGTLTRQNTLGDGGFMEEPETQLLVLKSSFTNAGQQVPKVGQRIARQESESYPLDNWKITRIQEDDWRVAFMLDLRSFEK